MLSDIRALHVPNELLVKTRAALTTADAETLEHELGAKVVRAFDMPPEMGDRFGGSLYQVRVPAGRTLQQAMAEMRRRPGVEYVEPNFVVQELEVPREGAPGSRDPLAASGDPLAASGDPRPGPGDPLAASGDPRPAPGDPLPREAEPLPREVDPRLWGLYNPPTRADVHAPEAWRVTTGRTVEQGGPLIAVIDTGLDRTHPDLVADAWANSGEVPGDGIDNDGNGFVDDVHGWDFANQDNDPMDDKGHGTHVSGTIAATGEAGTGVVGVAWRASLMPLKFLGQFGGTVGDAISAIIYATAMGARVTSNSWGGVGYSQALRDAMQASPALHICAAGNDGKDTDQEPVYPASYDLDNILTVAATDRQDQLASFSNRGVRSVDLAAPGVDIYSTLPGGQYGTKSGTSMATPHVTGAAALILSQHPDISNEDLKARLMYSTDPVPSLEQSVGSGGRLNAARALVEDAVPPSAPTALRVVDSAADALTLAWTAGGDDGTQGTAAGYELRVAEHPIAEDGRARPGETAWRDAQPVPLVPRPEASGMEQRVRVPLLPAGAEMPRHFALRARDKVGNPSPLVRTMGATPGVPMAFRDDFESGGAGWTADGTWAIVAENGNHFFTDSPGGTYPSDASTHLTSPPIDLSRVRKPRLTFATRYNVEPKFDHAAVEVSADDGRTWTELEALSGKAGWARHDLDLGAYEGRTVRIRFSLKSDGDIEFDGVSVDDVLVVGEAP